MLFIAVLVASFLGVAASTPGLLTETELPKTGNPSVYVEEGVGKYTIMLNAWDSSEIFYRINGDEWQRYKTYMAIDEYGSYTVEAYAISPGYAPSDIVSKSFVVDAHTGENLVDPDAGNSSYIFHNGFKYKINGSTLSLTRQTDKLVNGDLVIPASITKGGVTYPVTEVESWACYSCHNLKSVQIPSSVTEIGLYAFNGCTKLKSIKVDANNPNYSDRDGVLYNKAGIYLYCYPNARATHYTIPDGVTMIYYSGFQECVDLVSVTIPNSVTSIRTSAFSCCFSLESVALPNNLGNLEAGAFSSCRELKSVTLSTKYNKVPEWCFSDCWSLESIEFPANIRTIAYGAFEDCRSLRTVTLNQGLRTIEETAFNKCSSLDEITIPSTVTSIGEPVFWRCTSLKNIYVSPSNNYYCDVDGVLYNKNKTTLLAYSLGNPRPSYHILPTTQVISTKAFDSSQALQLVSIPASVTTVGECAFMYCNNLNEVYCYVANPANITLDSSSGFIFYQSPSNYPERILHVPAGSAELYQAETKWSNYFGIIKEMNGPAGDLDDDDNLTISDVTSLIDMLLNGSAIPPTADMDGNGVVNIADVITMIDMLLSGATEPVAHQSGDVETITVNGVSFNMVYVAAGTFEMGAPPEAYYNVDNCRPVHQVTLSEYYIGQTEVTQELWTAVMGSNPSYYVSSNQQPVHMINWSNCQTFITKLNQLTGKNFRLPTEAEWEYAARGADKTHGYEYAGGVKDELNDICWNSSNSSQGEFGYGPQPVARKRPNEIGLYDMSGNLEEWLNDWYTPYTEDAQVNPQGPSTGTYRCVRGGSFSHNWWDLRVFQRHSCKPTDKLTFYGMRLAMSM